MWIQLHHFPPPVQRRTFAPALGQLRHNSGGARARRFHFQNAARGQTGVAFIAVFDVEHGPAHQSLFLPADVKIVAAPDRSDQKNQSEKKAEQKSDDCSLCSFD